MKQIYTILGFIAGTAILIGGLGLLGVNGGSASHSGGSANVSGNVTGAQLAPDILLSRLGGGTISLVDYRGEKPVVLDFWASWCPNCRRDMPVLNRLYEKYKDEIEVIGVNLQEREKTVQEFIDTQGITFPIALDPGGRAAQAFGIQYTNTHFLIDRDGTVVRMIPGDIKESDLQILLN